MTAQSSSLCYREGSITDKEQLKHIGLVSFGQHLPLLSADNQARMLASLNDEQKLEELIAMSKIFVCQHGDRIVGTAYFISHGHPWDVFKPEWSYIRMVGVEPAYQGKGIARQLTALCIEEAQRSGEQTIALHTSEIMHAARHIYESLGFTQLFEMEKRLGIRYWLYTLNLK